MAFLHFLAQKYETEKSYSFWKCSKIGDLKFFKIYFFGYIPGEKQVGKCLHGTMLLVYSLCLCPIIPLVSQFVNTFNVV
jgi:hypothetical protein